MGIWSPFFGKPAYTMTLSARLALQTGAAVLLAWGERRSWGRGYVIHVRPLGEALSPDLERALLQVSRAMEGLIHACPSQYLWGYGRYKPPRAEL
jgi:KDO2-lipid IV(A) lauroyltransferase